MITQDQLPALLQSLGFSKKAASYTKIIGSATLEVNTAKQEIIYPEGVVINERQTCNFLANENFVVLECVHRLLEKGYKPEHLELEPKWQLGHGASGGRADILVKDNAGRPLLIIECKTAGNEFKRAWYKTLQDGNQLFSYAQQISETQFLCLYASDFEAGTLSYQSHLIAHRDNPKYLEDNPAFKSFKSATDVKERFAVWRDTYKLDFRTQGLFEPTIQPYHVGKEKYTLADLHGIAAADQQKKYHEFATILRQHNVSGRENAFDKLVNLFLCKLVDETENPQELKFYWKGVAYDTHFDLIDRLQQLYQKGMEKFLGETITYIDQGAVQNAMRFIKQNPDATQKAVWHLFLQQKFFTNNDFSLIDVHNEKLFYQNADVLLKILQMWQDIRLTNSVGNNQFLGDMFEGFLDQGVKQSEGQYFTPMPICRFIFMSLPLQSMVTGSATPTKAIDYACGAGHFLNELASQIKPLITQHWQGELVDLTDHLKAQHRTIYGIEKEYRLSKVAKVSAFMYGQQDINICYGDGLVQQHPAFPGIQNDSFDLLVANPPYSVRGFLETLPEEERDNYALSDTVDKLDSFNSIEAFFIERAKQLLKAGGVAAIILPSSILSNGSGTYIKTREILLQYFDIVAIAELGGGTFGKTGTNTVTLFLRRKKTSPDTAAHYRERVAQWFNTDEGQSEYHDAHLIERYAAHIGVPLADYKTLLEGSIAGAWTQSAHFDVYTKAFNDNTEVKNLYKQKAFKLLSETQQTEQLEKRYLRYVTALERDKLYYFVLASDQMHPVLIVKSPSDNKAQKAFLGYDSSTSKGDEGIKLVRNAQGHHQTHLYDETDRNNASKLNRLVADNFDGKLGAIPATLSEFASTARLVDMLDFSRAGFEKRIALTATTTIKNDLLGEKLGDVCSFEYGKPLPENQRITGSYPVMGSNGRVGFHNEYLVEGPVIVVGRKGSAGEVVWEKENCFPIDTTFYVRLKRIDVLPYYLFNVLKGLGLDRLRAGVGVPGLNRNDAYQLRLRIPSFDVQRLIVAEFDEVDAEIDRVKSKIVAAQSEINEQVKLCFSHHPVKQLNQIADLSRGASPRPIDDFWTDAADGVPWIKIGDVATGAKYVEVTAQKITPAGAEKSKRVRPGDFIISNSMSVGRPYISAIEGCVHDGWLVLANIIDEVDKNYLYYALSSDSAQSQFQAQALGGVVKNLNIDRAKGVTIAIPPLAEQRKLVKAVQVIEQTIAQAQATLAAAPAKKQAVMQRYL
jgi:type I restriction enzyme M protein